MNTPDMVDVEDPAMLEEFMPSVLTMLVAYPVKDMSSHEISDLLTELEPEDGSIRGPFCDRFDLGEAIYDAFDLYEVDVDKTLAEIYSQRLIAEKEVSKQ